MRRSTPTWVAARPAPSASNITCISSATCSPRAASKSSTARAFSRSAGSPHWQMIENGSGWVTAGTPPLADAQRAHRGVALHDADRQLRAAQPVAQAGGVARDLDPRQAEARRPGARAVGADEEGQERLPQRLLDAGHRGRQAIAADGVDLQAEALDVVDEDGVGQQAVAGDDLLQDAADRRGRRLLGVVDGQELEVAGAERHDPVVRALPVMVAAGLHGEAERGLDARRRGLEVGGAVDHVVESHRAPEKIDERQRANSSSAVSGRGEFARRRLETMTKEVDTMKYLLTLTYRDGEGPTRARRSSTRR